MRLSNKKSFTLLELIIAIGLFGIGLIAVFTVLNSGFNSMQQARSHVIATNLAREGVEMVFNLRDTNIRKRAGKKDLCRLSVNTPGTNVNNNDCENSPWLSDATNPSLRIGQRIQINQMSGGEITAQDSTFYGNAAFLVTGAASPTSSTQMFAMCMNTVTNKWEQCIKMDYAGAPNQCYDISSRTPGNVACSSLNLTQDTLYGRFYREIISQGLYYKDPSTTGGVLLGCTKGNMNDPITGMACGDSNPKEFRFCSRVTYFVGKSRRSVELCSLITNFNE